MKWFLPFAVFLVCVCAARAGDTDFSSSGDGKPHPAYTVDAEHLARLPHWSLDDGTPPPFELNDALQLVRRQIQKQIPDKDWRLRQAFLRHKNTEAGTVAYYELSVDYRRKEVHDSWEKLWVFVVLMDGTVLASDPHGT